MSTLAKPEPRAKVKARQRRAKATAWQVLRATVYDRDLGRCRVCHVPVKFQSAYPWDIGHTHHLTYRSRGGADRVENLVLLCGECHSDVHDRRLVLTGTADALRVERVQ